MGHRRPRQFYDDNEILNEDDTFKVKGQKACRVCHDFTSWVQNKNSKKDLVHSMLCLFIYAFRSVY